MRRFYAWLLLIVSTTQWIGGHVCFEVRHFMEVPQEMSAAEHSISNDILEQTGVEASVTILPDSQHVRWGADYGNYFAFSKSDSSGTVYFTIDYAPRTTVWEDVAHNAPTKQHDDDAAQTNLLKLLFSDFLFPSAELPSNDSNGLAVANFQLKGIQEHLQASPLSPPPDFYC